MSRTGDTKKRIIEILKKKNETLTGLCDNLELSPSTISQHLQEMVDSGMIRQVDGQRKWKYYEVNQSVIPNGGSGGFKRFVIPILIVMVVASVLAAYALTAVPTTNAQQVYLAPGSEVPNNSTVITISDSPTTYTINSLLITINGAKIHSITTGKWYSIPAQTNTFDLVALRNVSKVFSGVNLPNGTYDVLVFDVSNATALINGTYQNVALLRHDMVMVGDFNISNGTTNWINFDFDLNASLHVACGGRVMLLPVINVMHTANATLGIDQNSRIYQESSGWLKSSREFGMNLNGTMVGNFLPPMNMIGTKGNNPFFNPQEAMPFINLGQGGIRMAYDTNATHCDNMPINSTWMNNRSINNTRINGMPMNGTHMDLPYQGGRHGFHMPFT